MDSPWLMGLGFMSGALIDWYWVVGDFVYDRDLMYGDRYIRYGTWFDGTCGDCVSLFQGSTRLRISTSINCVSSYHTYYCPSTIVKVQGTYT